MDDGQVEDHRMRMAGLGIGLRIVLGAKVEAMEQLGFMDGHLLDTWMNTWMDTCWTLEWTIVGQVEDYHRLEH